MSVVDRVKATLKIENMVASTSVGDYVDLVHAAELFEGAEYDPEHFSGVIVRLKDPSSTVLVFRSGKMVSTGAKGYEIVEDGIGRVVEAMYGAGLIPEIVPYIQYKNIVFSANLGVQLNMNKVALGLGLENVEYEPDTFPGMVYRLFVPKVVILIFSTGRLVITGCKEYDDALEALDIIVRDLEEMDILE
ncbi:MAG: TATA-box-binding protein [ANME-2 cluster archaeon]|nr:TATA-box-binding protein [ANME-2 cluster archaeon]